jgi:hypothetical protein
MDDIRSCISMTSYAATNHKIIEETWASTELQGVWASFVFLFLFNPYLLSFVFSFLIFQFPN